MIKKTLIPYTKYLNKLKSTVKFISISKSTTKQTPYKIHKEVNDKRKQTKLKYCTNAKCLLQVITISSGESKTLSQWGQFTF